MKHIVLLLIIITTCITSCILGDDNKLGESVTVVEEPDGKWDPMSDSSLIAWYSMDGDSKDISGNGHDGTIYGDVRVDNDHHDNVGKALFFDGLGDYIYIPSAKGFSLSDSSFSLSVWVKPGDLSSFRTIISILYDTANVLFEHKIHTPDFSSYIVFRNSSNLLNAYYPSEIISTDTWYHLVWVYNGSSIRGYINGVLGKEANMTAFSYVGKGDSYIGSTNVGSNCFYGVIDDIAIFRKALSDSEIEILYNLE